MKRNLSSVLLVVAVATLPLASCSKKAKEETKEATEAVKEDMKDAATQTKSAISDVATDVKEGAKDVASDVKGAAQATASTIKKASDQAVEAIDTKLSKMDKQTRAQYHALDNEITRIDAEIRNASEKEKARLRRTKEQLVKKRDELLAK
jgi:hypothetical protein